MPAMIGEGVLGYLAPRARAIATGRARCSSWSAWAIGSSTSRASSPAARCSARRSPGRWSSQPRVLLADEPTGNLDKHTGEEIMAILRRLNREQNLTIVMVTHDPRIADQADRTVTLVDGRVVAA